MLGCPSLKSEEEPIELCMAGLNDRTWQQGRAQLCRIREKWTALELDILDQKRECIVAQEISLVVDDFLSVVEMERKSAVEGFRTQLGPTQPPTAMGHRCMVHCDSASR